MTDLLEGWLVREDVPVREVVMVLRDSLTARGVRQWMVARNRLLGGRRPVELLAAGEADAVLKAARAFVDGVYV